jgi:hypothetical protein
MLDVGPKTMREEDVVVVLFGGSVPFTLHRLCNNQLSGGSERSD